MICSEGPSLRLADRALGMTDLEKQFDSLDFSCIYERKAQGELANKEIINGAQELECNCVRPKHVSSKHDRHSFYMHKDYSPSLEAINEEQGESDASSVAELGMKYDLTLPDRHYHQAKNMGYLQHRKGRHYRRKVFTKENDFPRRPRSITF